MIKTNLGRTFLILSAIMVLFAAANGQGKSDKAVPVDPQSMKDAVTKVGVGHEITIKRKDGQEFYGSVVTIGDDKVIIAEADIKANIEIPYAQMDKVSKGYGHSRAWNGKRIPPKKHTIGLILASAAILIPVIILLASMD